MSAYMPNGDPNPWPGRAGPPTDAVCACGHPDKHHSAGECWTRADGTETEDDDAACSCGWFRPVGGAP